MSILSDAVLLFLVMDPLGNVPVFLAVLREVPADRRRAVLVRELVVALGILLVFLFAGERMLDMLSLREETILIAGGLVLFLIALRMIFPPERGGVMGELPEGEPFVFPLAVPLVAGPSTLATLLFLVRSHPGGHWDLLWALGGAWLATALVLGSSTAILRITGRRGLIALERLMGMLLVMIAVQMTLDGIRAALA